MKKIFRRPLIFAVMLSFAAALTACSVENTSVTHSIAEAKTDYYDTEEALFNASPVVVLAEKTETEENVSKGLYGNRFYMGYTLSDLTVKAVIKNTASHELAAGDMIKLVENQFTFKSPAGYVISHTNYYTKTSPGSSYILYLDYLAGEDTYSIVTGFQGKLPVSDEEPILFSPGENEKTDTKFNYDEYDRYTAALEGIREDALKRLAENGL